VRLANELLVEVITAHIGDTLDFFWVFLSFKLLAERFHFKLGISNYKGGSNAI